MEGSTARRMAGAALALAISAIACGEIPTKPSSLSSSTPALTTPEAARFPTEPLKISSFSMETQGEREKNMQKLLDKDIDMEIDKINWQITEAKDRPISDKCRYIEVSSTTAGPRGFLVLVTIRELSELIATGFYGLKKNSIPERVFPVPIPPHKHLWFKDIFFEGKPTFKFEKITPPES